MKRFMKGERYIVLPLFIQAAGGERRRCRLTVSGYQ